VLREETLQVSGVRCERCVMRLGSALQKLDGIESANANLMGQVTLAWDEERLPREALLEALARGGFHVASSGAMAAPGLPDGA
jgi:copper chaperone CopZ